MVDLCDNEDVQRLLSLRSSTHGDANKTFRLAGELVMDFIAHKTTQGVIEPHEFAAINILHKIARIACGDYTDDHWDDICGYAQLGKELHKQLTDPCQEG